MLLIALTVLIAAIALIAAGLQLCKPAPAPEFAVIRNGNLVNDGTRRHQS